jgi:hypothetical protein
MNGMDTGEQHQHGRFRDPRGRLEQFARFDVLVRCPRCDACAVSRGSPVENRWVMWRQRRLVCADCGYADSWSATRRTAATVVTTADHRAAAAEGALLGAGVDPHFRLPLWLTTSCCGGHTLWAWNPEHLDVLDGYLGARLRERGDQDGYTSMLEKLPTWMKTAKNRDELAKVIARLRATLPTSQ